MSEKTWWDPQTKIIRSQDPAKMNPQQRANWVLLQYVLEAEYQRGYSDGIEKGKTGLDMPRAVL